MSRPRPFRERRRTRSLEDARHEALDSVDRLLVRHEKTIERLMAEKEKYRCIFEEAPVGIFQMSPAWRFLKVNRMTARIFGCESPEQLLTESADLRKQIVAGPGGPRAEVGAGEQHGIIALLGKPFRNE